MFNSLKRKLLGTPMATAQARHERLAKIPALAIFCSDALSSVAYAPEEIALVLVLAGTAALSLSVPIAIAIATLIAIVATSYWQTIHAYPAGGGAYTVAKENLGVLPGLVAGASLLVGYVLTVAVSISSGIAIMFDPCSTAAGNFAVTVATLRSIGTVRSSVATFAAE